MNALDTTADDYEDESPEETKAALREAEDVKAWLERIKEAREFDKVARAQYARNRRYARGDAGDFDVSVPIAGTYIDILTSFLYARNPDLNVMPADSVGPSRLRDTKDFAKTLEIVIAQMWRAGKIKSAAAEWVRSCLTVGLGWIKCTWQERRGEDPIVRRAINDLQDNIARLRETQRAIVEGEAPNDDAAIASLEQQLIGLQAQVEVVVARGLAIDFVLAEDMQVAPSAPSVARYLDAPWIAHRTFLPLPDARAAFPRIAAKLGSATSYHQSKPTDPAERRDAGSTAEVSADEADTFKSGGVQGSPTLRDGSVCVWEVWCRDTNTIITLVEGLDCYAVEPRAPNPGTRRFYPFFQVSIIKVDGERHPMSLVTRSMPLLDEYNRTRSNYRTHRSRCLPKTAFDATNLSPTEINALAGATIGEMVPLKPLNPSMPVKDALFEVTYPSVDPALYDTAVIRAELEMIWGIQEALSSTIRTAKTATEAEIQQTGTSARTGYMRDALEEALSELAEYTAQIALQKLSRPDAVKLAGPEAMWPEGLTIDEIDLLVSVEIRAGSSGKPNTTQEREAWATTMPLLQGMIMQIAQLRASSPIEVADCLEQLVVETFERAGDRVDPERFLPDPPQLNPATGMPMVGPPGTPAAVTPPPPGGAAPPPTQALPPAPI